MAQSSDSDSDSEYFQYRCSSDSDNSDSLSTATDTSDSDEGHRNIYVRSAATSRPLPLPPVQNLKPGPSQSNVEDRKILSNFLRKRIGLGPSSVNDDDPDTPSFHRKRKAKKKGLPAKSRRRFYHQQVYAQAIYSIRIWSQKLKEALRKDPAGLEMQHLLEYMKTDVMEQMVNDIFANALFHRDLEADYNIYSHPHHWGTISGLFGMDHPFWKKYKGVNFKELLQDTADCCLDEIFELAETHIDLVKTVKEWRAVTEKLVRKHLTLLVDLRSLESSVEAEDSELDEFCNSGKHSLDFIFSTPYFKLSSMDFTLLVFPKDCMENVFGDALFCDTVQQWTPRDYASLRTAIRDVIVGEEYAALAQRHSYLISRFFYSTSHFNNDEGIGSSSYGGSGINKKGTRPIARSKISTTVSRKFNASLDVDDDSNPGSAVTACARYTTKPKEVQEWFQREENRLRKLTYQSLMDQNKINAQMVDWYNVGNLVTEETGKDRSGINCRLVWLNDRKMKGKAYNKAWSKADMKTLVKLGNERKLRWEEIAGRFLNRTAYQCFVKYQNSAAVSSTMNWTENKDELVKQVLVNEGPKWGKAAEVTLDLNATALGVEDRWKKTINPMIRRGAFTRVEDTLLILTLEKLMGFIQQELNFRIIQAHLPWRCETVWRDRANCLFSDFIIPWTIDEDKKLLKLAKRAGKNDWQKISKQFSSCKNRKNCYTRFLILRKKIGPDPTQFKFKTLEEYHEAYSMTRYNVFQFKHLREIVQVLKNMLKVNKPSSPFPGFNPEAPPSELELRWMLLDFDRGTMEVSVKHIEQYTQSRSSHFDDWIHENGQKKKTFDRRSFHRGDPKSTASVIHIRGLELVPEKEVKGPPILPFESQVYFHYARFRRTKSLNESMERPYLPSARKLCKLPEIRRILVKPPLNDSKGISDSDSESDSDARNKKESSPSTVSETETVVISPPRKRGRPRKILNRRPSPTINKGTKTVTGEAKSGVVVAPSPSSPSNNLRRSLRLMEKEAIKALQSLAAVVSNSNVD